jgi:hypothetical protein
MFVILCFYLIVGVMWGAFCFEKQAEYYPDAEPYKKWVGLLLNTWLWPISIIIYLIRIINENNRKISKISSRENL